jgi:hypothetical protein
VGQQSVAPCCCRVAAAGKCGSYPQPAPEARFLASRWYYDPMSRGSASLTLAVAFWLGAAGCAAIAAGTPTDAGSPEGSFQRGWSRVPDATPTASVGWTTRAFDMVGSGGRRRSCVELAYKSSVAQTCSLLPGVSSWIVGGDHFVLAQGTDIPLDDGSTIAVNQDGVAIGLIGLRHVVGEAPASELAVCERADLAVAMSQWFGATSPAWLLTRCSPEFAVAEYGYPSDDVVFFEHKKSWVVLGIKPSGSVCPDPQGAFGLACQALFPELAGAHQSGQP